MVKKHFEKLQNSWWDFTCNIHKGCESVFKSVTCCSGCLSAYRRNSIANFMSYWIQTNDYHGTDRELSAYDIAATQDTKDKILDALSPESFSQNLKIWVSQYDDSEDRGLTANSLIACIAIVDIV